MDHETISRKEKIEIARRLAGTSGSSGYKKHAFEAYRDNLGNDGPDGQTTGGRFFLRLLLSGFFFLVVLSVTEFHAMGKEQAGKYQVKIENALKTQTGMEKIKELIRSIG